MENVNLPSYAGSKDKYLSCHQFLFIVQEIGRSNLWSDTKMMQIIVECLENEALEWYNNIHPCSSLDQLKILMISAFSPKISIKHKIQLRNSLVQEEEENVEEFYERCKTGLTSIHDDKFSDLLDERDLLVTFLHGLKSDLQEIVMKSDANNLDAFLEAAIKVENVHTSLKVETINELNQNDLDEAFHGFSDDDFEDKPISDFLFKNNVFKCELCGFSYTNEELLNEHMTNEHNANSKLRCHVCSVTFQTKRIYNFHMQNSHPDTCHKCHLCSQIFYHSYKLDAHMNLKHVDHLQDYNLTCQFCSKEYSNKNSLKAHIHMKHTSGKTFQCQVCPKVFTSSSNLKTHVRIVHLMERPYECSECGKSYASEGGLSAHQASIHGKGERLQCDKCDMSFPYKSALTTHILNRHNRGTFICDECGVANNTKEALRVHKIQQHSEDKGKKLPCPYAPDCKEKFRVPFQVRNHVKRVHKKVEGTHACSLCPKKYHSRQRLESHINGVHLNKKPYKCPHCEFASAYQGHVKDHIRASHDAVKYPCPYPMCNHQSSYKGNLDKHIKNIHTKNTATENTIAIQSQAAQA